MVALKVSCQKQLKIERSSVTQIQKLVVYISVVLNVFSSLIVHGRYANMKWTWISPSPLVQSISYIVPCSHLI